MPSIDARILLRRPSSTFTDQEFPSASAEGERPEGDLDKDSSKPSRRKSEVKEFKMSLDNVETDSQLPAGTQDPIIRNTSLCDTLLILTSLDKHLASGFSTTYPEQIAQYCDEALWAQFILDINEAARRNTYVPAMPHADHISQNERQIGDSDSTCCQENQISEQSN